MTDESSVWVTGETHTQQVEVPGPPGPPPTLVVGPTTNTLGEPNVTITNLGEGVYRLDFALKQGNPGSPGTAGPSGVIASATAEAVPYTEPASVEISGIAPNQTMHFKIPRSEPTPGEPGPPGIFSSIRSVTDVESDEEDPEIPDNIALFEPSETEIILRVLIDSDYTNVSMTEYGEIQVNTKVSEWRYRKLLDQTVAPDTPTSITFAERKLLGAEDWDVAVYDGFTAGGIGTVKMVALLHLEQTIPEPEEPEDPPIEPKPINVQVLKNDQPLELPYNVNILDGHLNIALPAIPVVLDDTVKIVITCEHEVIVGQDSYMTLQRYY